MQHETRNFKIEGGKDNDANKRESQSVSGDTYGF